MRRALVIAINNELAELAGDTLGAAGFEATDLNPDGGYLISTPRGGGLYSSPYSLGLINGDGGYNALEIISATGQLTYNTNPVWHDGLYNVSTFIRTTGNQIITGFLDIVGDLVGTRVQSYDGTFFGSTNNVNIGPSPFSGANGTITIRPDGVGSTTGQLEVTNATITHDGVPMVKASLLKGHIDGLKLEWVSVNAVRASSGSAYIQSLNDVLELPSAVTKSGLSMAASTWYHVYLYRNGSTPDIEVVTTAPATPYSGAARAKTGDTSRRYLGSFLTDTSGLIHQFIQSGNLVLYPRAGAGGGSVFRVLSAKITAAEQAVSLSGVIPSTASGVFARFFFNRSIGDNAMNFGPISGLPKLSNVTSPGVAFFTVPLDSSLTLYIQLNNDVTDGNGAAYIDVNGFTFER